MALTSCLLKFAAMVAAFSGQNSMVNITSPKLSEVITSMAIQFKTTQSSSQIAAMMSGGKYFAINIESKKLILKYNFNQTGNGTFDLGVVNTNRWFVLNITTRQRSTIIQLSDSDKSVTLPCPPKFTATINMTLLGEEFSNLLKTTGLKIGGSSNDKSLKSFQGCIGLVGLNNHVIDLVNETKDNQPFQKEIVDTLPGCRCGQVTGPGPCVKGLYLWDNTKGICECKCNLGYYGELCENKSMTENDDDANDIYIIVGVAVGVLLLITLVICLVLYIKRTSSSVFGVYNPKNQEQIQGQQMNTAFTLPVPEKLI